MKKRTNHKIFQWKMNPIFKRENNKEIKGIVREDLRSVSGNYSE